ncbi:MAG: M23 family metallopeptidase [Alphaproteobacteria bacterium]|nr:M23 family metallopeptidase [Alphaproteobacteria bacterium]
MNLAVWFSLFLSSFAWIVAPATAHAQQLRFPIDCSLGETCFIQNWIDLDPGPGRADPACGPLSYDGHDGLDIRVPMRALRSGVVVRAPAAGVVRAVREGESDGVYRATGRVAAAGRECGNGVVIDHGAGLETQLCHLQRGSIAVRTGQRVQSGHPVGRVGLSGSSEFPHLHFSLRRDGQKIDPFRNAMISSGTCATGRTGMPRGLWERAPGYVATAIVDAGFSDAPPTQAARADDAPPASGSRIAPALVAWTIIMGPRRGDETTLQLLSPEGAILSESRVPHPRDQTQYALFVGKRRPGAAWPAGDYRAEIVVRRAGAVVARRTEVQTVR